MTRPLGKRPSTVTHYCHNCGRRLKPDFGVVYERRETDEGYETFATFDGTIRGYGYRCNGVFCSNGCGFAFGLVCARQGAPPREPPKKRGA